MQNKTIIFTTNAHAAGIGVYKSDEQEFIVSVFKKAGRSTYSYTINGTDMHRYCVEACEAWGEVMEFLGCDIVVADKKTMKTFDIYKEAVNIRAEEKRAREAGSNEDKLLPTREDILNGYIQTTESCADTFINLAKSHDLIGKNAQKLKGVTYLFVEDGFLDGSNYEKHVKSKKKLFV